MQTSSLMFFRVFGSESPRRFGAFLLLLPVRLLFSFFFLVGTDRLLEAAGARRLPRLTKKGKKKR